MREIIMFFVSALLSYLLSPGILLTLPRGGSKHTVAATHALLFAVFYYLLQNVILHIESRYPMNE